MAKKKDISNYNPSWKLLQYSFSFSTYKIINKIYAFLFKSCFKLVAAIGTPKRSTNTPYSGRVLIFDDRFTIALKVSLQVAHPSRAFKIF